MRAVPESIPLYNCYSTNIEVINLFLSEVLGWLSILYNVVLVIQPVAVIACNMQIFTDKIFFFFFQFSVSVFFLAV